MRSYCLFIVLLGFSFSNINYNIIKQFNNLTNKKWQYKWNDNGTVHRVFGNFISQNLNVQDKNESELKARNFIEQNNFLFNVNNTDLELWVNDMKGNIRYLIFNQTYQGIPVWNARIDFRYRLNGDLVLLGNDTFSDIDIDINSSITMLEATEIAKDHVGYNDLKGDYIIEESEQFIWAEKNKNISYHLIWLIELYINEIDPDHYELPVNRWKIFVDANTGFAVGRDGLILKTINGGSDWTSIDGGTSMMLWVIYFVDVSDFLFSFSSSTTKFIIFVSLFIL